MKLIPASSARWMMRIESSWSAFPHAPNIIVPRHSFETWTPARPKGRYSILVLLSRWGRPLALLRARPRAGAPAPAVSLRRLRHVVARLDLVGADRGEAAVRLPLGQGHQERGV